MKLFILFIFSLAYAYAQSNNSPNSARERRAPMTASELRGYLRSYANLTADQSVRKLQIERALATFSIEEFNLPEETFNFIYSYNQSHTQPLDRNHLPINLGQLGHADHWAILFEERINHVNSGRRGIINGTVSIQRMRDISYSLIPLMDAVLIPENSAHQVNFSPEALEQLQASIREIYIGYDQSYIETNDPMGHFFPKGKFLQFGAKLGDFEAYKKARTNLERFLYNPRIDILIVENSILALEKYPFNHNEIRELLQRVLISTATPERLKNQIRSHYGLFNDSITIPLILPTPNVQPPARVIPPAANEQ